MKNTVELNTETTIDSIKEIEQNLNNQIEKNCDDMEFVNDLGCKSE